MGLGSEIREKKLFQIPDPGVKKAPDPGSGSATLVFAHEEVSEKIRKVKEKSVVTPFSCPNLEKRC
jgi:hypothetical protein